MHPINTLPSHSLKSLLKLSPHLRPGLQNGLRILNLGTRWRWLVSLTSRPLYPRPTSHCWSGRGGVEKNSHHGTRMIQAVCTEWVGWTGCALYGNVTTDDWTNSWGAHGDWLRQRLWCLTAAHPSSGKAPPPHKHTYTHTHTHTHTHKAVRLFLPCVGKLKSNAANQVMYACMYICMYVCLNFLHIIRHSPLCLTFI
jgi:hypothetical protein